MLRKFAGPSLVVLMMVVAGCAASQNLRSATWWGWTTTPAEATLHFEVIVGP